MKTIEIATRSKEDMIDITVPVRDALGALGPGAAACLVYVPHTTAGLTINENADPSVPLDILMALKKTVPDSLPYSHAEGNSPAHVKAGLLGSSVLVPIKEGRLALGTWQGIFFCEFDGPRRRKVHIRLLG